MKKIAPSKRKLQEDVACRSSARCDNYLKRYTSIRNALKLALNKEIVLINPSYWPDKNDVELLECYRIKKKLTSMYVLCMVNSKVKETIHHWSQSARGEVGCCIELHKDEFLRGLKKTTKKLGYKLANKRIKYVRTENNNQEYSVDMYPFVKREVFRCEGEYRVLVTSTSEQEPVLKLPIELSCVRKINFSFGMPDILYKHFKEFLETKLPSDVEVGRSRLNYHPRFISKVKGC